MTHTPALVKVGTRWIDATDIRMIEPCFDTNEIVIWFHNPGTPCMYLANSNGNLEKDVDKLATAINLARQGAAI